MELPSFTKPAGTPEQLLSKLIVQGLHVPADERDEALHYFRFVGAYRLKGYWHHEIDPATKRFPDGFTFTSIRQRYEFDRELRAITLAAIERLEVAIRVVIADYLSLRHSPHWFLDHNVFHRSNSISLGEILKKIEGDVASSTSSFIRHYQARYGHPYLPPSWAITECVTFGIWSRLYQALRDPQDKKGIAKRFGIDQPETFGSWVHALTVLRNRVAHHGQLLYCQLRVGPSNYKRGKIRFTDTKTYYSAAVVIQYFLTNMGLPNRWQQQLSGLLASFPGIDAAQLGFPENWATTYPWGG
ncbi:Abi family protein [Uliginosibacterium sp. sgz301328]|uniref:Abi family protein n=1 Tax=Uliginosibacterium sp. sgz301328 TaxID=3243764 RepID=UPI00359D2C9A